MGGELILGPGTVVRSTNLVSLGFGRLWEAQVSIQGIGGTFITEIGLLTAAEPQLGELAIGFFVGPNGLVARTGLEEAPIQIADPFQTHRVGFARGPQAVRFYVDGVEVAVLAAPMLGGVDVAVQLTNEDPTATVSYEWVRVHDPFAGPVVVGEPETQVTMLPSQWRYQKIMAFRADAFESTYRAEARDEVSTTSSLQVVAVETEPPSAPAEELVIAAVRVSGEESEFARKVGVIVDGEQTLMATSHRISRDSSALDGYHHVCGVADGRLQTEASKLSVGVQSPDGIRVDGASASIFVLRYPPR